MNEDKKSNDQIDLVKKRTKQDTQFKKGQVANPKGRPIGSGIQGELRKKLNKNLPVILDRLIEQALAGDLVAIKLLLERGFPAKRSESYIDLEIPESLTLAEKVDYALDAVTRGELATEIGNELAKAAVLSNTLKTTAVGSIRVIELNAGQLVAPDMGIEVKEPKDD